MTDKLLVEKNHKNIEYYALEDTEKINAESEIMKKSINRYNEIGIGTEEDSWFKSLCSPTSVGVIVMMIIIVVIILLFSYII